MKRQFRKRRGATLVEVVTASGIGVLVLSGAVMTLFAGMSSWAQGESRISAESDAQGAVRIISKELREAMAVSVDGNGRGLSYRLPERDGSGDYVVPAVWDGVTRRIEYTDGIIRTFDGESYRTICRGVILTDPLTQGGAGGYRPFVAGSGTIVRQVTVQIVKRAYGNRNHVVTSRRRESIFFRNIPELRN